MTPMITLSNNLYAVRYNDDNIFIHIFIHSTIISLTFQTCHQPLILHAAAERISGPVKL